ncbi:MAG: hypothetical protein IPK97_19940 [Ahniella sp.]|nr:hypothetical protein [Ahniella sp.]
MDTPTPAAPTAPSVLSLTQRLTPLIPEALLTLLFLLLAIDPWIGEPFKEFWMQQGYRPLTLEHPALMAILMVEVGFLLPQVTLTDLATRLKKRPPWWLIPPLAIGLLILAPGGMEFLRVLLANQSVLAIPALWSVFHRARQLWDMPGKPALERMRVRALTNGRANVGGLMVLIYLLTTMAQTSSLIVIDDWNWKDKMLLSLTTLYFAACTFDAWRVTGTRFAANPKPLLWFDYIGVKDVDLPL